jgi:DNA ligase-1
VEARIDPVLFGWSYDYVGDLAETVALIWPVDPSRRPNREPELSEVVEALRTAKRDEVQGLLEGWLDALDSTGRWALLKLVTGGLRVGLSARLAKTAAAMIRPERVPLPARPGEAAEEGAPLDPVDVAEIEEVWHALAPPYGDLIGPRPTRRAASGRSCWPTRSMRRSTSPSWIRPTSPPSGSGTASASRRCARAR